MIHKINKIKNLGMVFANYKSDATLPVFKIFNLFYGWNGSGKTTFSRLFNAIGGVQIDGLEYEVTDERSNTYAQGDTFPKKIRVFNQDYIQNNIRLLESRAKSISIVLGEENKELVEKIENDNKLLSGDRTEPSNSGKIELKVGHEKMKGKKSTERDGKFTDIAKTIGAVIGGNALRDYRKPQAEKEFAQLIAKTELSVDDLQKYSLTVKQDSKPEITSLVLQKVKLEDMGEDVEVSKLLKTITEEATIFLHKIVESEVIPRLASNEDIAQWVEQGLHLHKKQSSQVCEYCQQDIPSKRIEELAHHFSKEDENLKLSLDGLIEKLRKSYQVIEPLHIPDKARFYVSLQVKYNAIAESYEPAKRQILDEIKKLAEELKTKKTKTTEAVILNAKPNIGDYLAQVAAVNSLISEHNKTTKEYEKVKNDVIQKLKTHYLSTIYDEVKRLNAEVAIHEETIKSLGGEIVEIQKRIFENMIKVSSHHKACEDLNMKLATFLGHQELTFVPHTERKAGEDGIDSEVVVGYHIKRGNQLATYLSEGEKTAIAFVYFIVHLGDQSFNVTDGIIVVDDPISSLDSNSLYQAFSFLKNAVKDAGQVFIFTHSFDFLRLLINWRKGADRNATKSGYYTIKNHFPNDVRCASIEIMDRELHEYESEYHYLFKLLKKMRDEQNDTIAKAYPIPNIARKVWDYFLTFSVPNGKNPYQKMEELKSEGFDAQKLDAIYKFTNDQSHITGAGFDPALVPEAKKVINELFEMMGQINQRHYNHLNNATA